MLIYYKQKNLSVRLVRCEQEDQGMIVYLLKNVLELSDVFVRVALYDLAKQGYFEIVSTPFREEAEFMKTLLEMAILQYKTEHRNLKTDNSSVLEITESLIERHWSEI